MPRRCARGARTPRWSTTWRAASAPAIRTNSCAPTATARPTCSRPRRTTRRGASSWCRPLPPPGRRCGRSEEHTSELQSRLHLVCRLLLEKKKKKITNHTVCRIEELTYVIDHQCNTVVINCHKAACPVHKHGSGSIRRKNCRHTSAKLADD